MLREKAVVLIDGPALVHRWYHRWEYTTTKFGKAIDLKEFAVKNTRYLLATAHSFDPSHLSNRLLSPQLEYAHTPKHNKLMLFFDQGDGGRKELFPDYKKKRAEKKDLKSLRMIEKIAKKVFLNEPKETTLIVPDFHPSLQTLNAEADDMIATIALRNQKLKIPTVVMSHDFDLYQLIDDHRKSYNFDIRSRHLIHEKTVVERCGVHPKLIRDYKALAGDAADNIPGVKGIGKVGAAKLLKKYGDLEGVLTRGPQREKGSMATKIANGAESAFLSRQLVDFRMCPKLLKAAEKFLSS
eukprot:gene10106-7073_t